MNQDQINSHDPSKGILTITPEAFITLLKHVLFHVDPSSLQQLSVGGILTGDIIDEDIIIKEVIPCFHGHQLKMEFVDNYQKVLSQRIPKSGKAMGWYSSRLGDNVEFNPNNLQTHSLFQNMENPKAFTLIIGLQAANDLPVTLKAYRFHDLKNKIFDNIKPLSIVVQPPESINVFEHIQKIIEGFQGQKSIHQDEILLENALRAPIGNLASSSPAARIVLDKFKNSTNTIKEFLLANEAKLYSVINSILRNIQDGFNSVLQGMQTTLKQEAEVIMESVEQNFEEIQKDGDNLSVILNQMTDKISMDYGILLKNVLEPKLKDFKDNLVEIVEESADIEHKIELFTDSVKGQQNTLEIFRNSLETDTSSVEESIKVLKKKLDDKNLGIKKTTEKSIDKIQEEMKKIEESLQKIEKMMEN
ncbi:MAG: hypothetical protein JW776_13430 [Candidatus Lokiarchaeota archaeon]|nr:hypothetical protein [Candidatus Lokiarchaeota archaeon]